MKRYVTIWSEFEEAVFYDRKNKKIIYKTSGLAPKKINGMTTASVATLAVLYGTIRLNIQYNAIATLIIFILFGLIIAGVLYYFINKKMSEVLKHEIKQLTRDELNCHIIKGKRELLIQFGIVLLMYVALLLSSLLIILGSASITMLLPLFILSVAAPCTLVIFDPIQRFIALIEINNCKELIIKNSLCN